MITKRRTRKGPLTWAGVLLALAIGTALGQMPVYDELRQAESDHFIYIFQAKLRDRLPALCLLCEEAHAVLAPVYGWTPRRKTVILYHDARDDHNGWTTVFPRPIIELVAAGNPPGATTYNPGNELRSTVFHEYSHVLAMDAQYGLSAGLNSVFGRLVPLGDPLSTFLGACATPAGVLAPDWYLEGLAVWAESEFAPPGRGQGTIADMILRMAVAGNRDLQPPQWNLLLPEWPYGQASYLYGMRLMEYIRDQLDPAVANAPAVLSQSVAHSILFAFDAVSRPVTGITFARLAAAARRWDRQRQQARLAHLAQVPFTPCARRTPGNLQVTQPRFGPDGQAVFFCGFPGENRDTLYRYDRKTSQLDRLRAARCQAGLTRMAAAPGRETFYYTRLNTVGRDRQWNELLAYDAHAGGVRRITGQGRYRFVAVSPDGQTLAAVRNELGGYALLEVPLDRAGERAAETIRVQAPAGSTLADPVYLPNGQGVVYVEATRRGSQIRRVDRATGRDELLLDWPCGVLGPAVHPAGDRLVFSADRNGAFNLYELTLAGTNAPRPLTHVPGGVFQPDYAPDGRSLAAVGYDAHGYYLVVLDTDTPGPAGPVPVLPRDWSPNAANRARVAAARRAAPPALSPEHPYRALSGLGLDYWSPWFNYSGDEFEGGLALALSDPAARHSIQARGGYATRWRVPLGSGSWQYNGFYPLWDAYANYAPDSYANLVVDARDRTYAYVEKSGVAGAQMTLPFNTADHQLALSLGYEYLDRHPLDRANDDYQGQTLLTSNLYVGGEGAMYGRLTFFSATTFPQSFSYERGRRLSLAVAQSAPALGGHLQRTRALAGWNEYLPLPWGDNQVLKLAGGGGGGFGDDIAQGCFGLGGMDFSGTDRGPGVPRRLGLRGYDDNTQVGQGIAKAGAAYRFPLWRVYRGASATLPIYGQQLYGEVFYEGGQTFGDVPAGQPAPQWIQSAGLELNLSLTLFRYVDLAPGAGWVYAFDRADRQRQVYLSFKAAINF